MEIWTRYLFVILAIGMLLFLFNLGGRDLWEPDETRYAVVAREMRETGNWVLPHLNGEIYAEKPPFFLWLVNLCTFFLGENSELANRLPSALAGLVTLFVTFLLGERLFSPRVGFLSAMVLATSILFLQLSRWMMLDSLFSLLFLLTIFYFFQGFENEARRRRYYLFAGFFMGLGVLTKGPVVYLPVPMFMIFGLSQRKFKAYWNTDLLCGILVSLLIVFLWLLPACWVGGEEYTKRILFGQTLGRLMGSEPYFHKRSIFFYFIRFPLDFFPWIVLLPSAVISGFRNKKKFSEEFLLLSIWILFIFFFFTLSKGKKDNYLLPLYPAVAIVIGVLWDSELRSSKGGWGTISGLVFLAFLFVIGFFSLVMGVPGKLYSRLIPYLSVEPWTVFYLPLGSLVSVLFFLKRKKRASFIALVVTFSLFYLHLSFILPKFNAERSMKAFSERIVKRTEPEEELKMAFFRYNGLLYYTQKPFIEEIKRMDRFCQILQSTQKVRAVIPLKYFDGIKGKLSLEPGSVEQVRAGPYDLVLISNR
jgi:4-amino-4-deoxy-L-arabinose transferase-like glycosyltransferase